MADSASLPPQYVDPRFELLVNAVFDYAIYMIDPDGRVATWNAGAERFKGYRADEIIGQPFESFFLPEDRENGIPDRILRTAAEEGRYETEGWRLRKDGTTFFAHAIVDAIRNEAGELLGFAKITRDISAQKQREKELYESELRFRMLVQGVRDYAIYMLDKDGFVTNWNPGAEAIKGYTEAEIVGQHFSLFYTDEDRTRDEPARAMQTALREGKYEREAWRVRKDGSLFWASVLLDPIYNEQGEHVGFAKVTRDITERKRAQEQLQETQTALLQSQKLQALGELTGGIAHDFNNLMTVIGGSVELLRKRPDLPAEKRERYLHAIAETADRATKLTGQLLAFGRRQRLQPEVLDINLRLDAFGEMLARTLGSKFELRLELAPSLWRTEVDPTGLETALLNAAINSRDAMPNGGRITITTENCADQDGDKVCVSIEDNGEGMPPEVLARAFEPFYTTKPVGKGTGLGLSQIHGFAAQSGGRVEIESEPGKGTRVKLILPRTDKEPEAADAAAGHIALPEGLSVLLVEDSPQVRAFAKHLLEDLHCRVIEAEDAAGALRLLADNPVDLVFSDVVMPDVNGIDLACEIGRRIPGLPVILATGYSADVLAGLATEFEVLRKPYKSETVAAAIASALAGDKAERIA